MRFSYVRPCCVVSLAVIACSCEKDAIAPSLRVVLDVSGTGVVDLSAAGASNATFEFVAQKKADSTVSGQFRQSRSTPSGTVDFAGVVTCLTSDPNFPGRARIGGRVTQNNSTHAGFLTANHEVGDDVWFRVLDGGSAAGAIDRSTTYGFRPTLVDTSEQYCALPFDGLPAWNPASIFPLASGSIQVKVNR